MEIVSKTLQYELLWFCSKFLFLNFRIVISMFELKCPPPICGINWNCNLDMSARGTRHMSSLETQAEEVGDPEGCISYTFISSFLSTTLPNHHLSSCMTNTVGVV